MTNVELNRPPVLPEGAAPEGGGVEAPRRTILQESWSLFRKNRLSMAGMVIFIIFFIVFYLVVTLIAYLIRFLNRNRTSNR